SHLWFSPPLVGFFDCWSLELIWMLDVGIWMLSRPVPPMQNHLPAIAFQHRLEPLLELREMKPMRYDWPDIEPGFQHDRHLVPRLVHLAPVNPLDRQHVEHDLVPINSDRL